MKKTIEQLIEARVDITLSSFTARELAELVVAGTPGGFIVALGYSIYGYNGAFWRPIITLKHVFKTKEKAEEVIEAILCSEALDMNCWDSPSDPFQDELVF